MQYKNVKFLVFGLKDSGVSSAEFLLKNGAQTGLYDDNEEVYSSDRVLSLVKSGCRIVTSEEVSFYDVIVVSPGVAADNKLLVECKRLKKRIISELELGYLNCKAPIIAVSGTNGKTTVSTIIHNALKCAGENSFLAGNIGIPLISIAENTSPKDVCVCEVSSFQLETSKSFTPHIGVMLNVTPDHLDRHYTFENYVYLKKKLFANMRESEYAILNYDDPTVKKFATEINAKVCPFSTKEAVNGGFFDGKTFYFKSERIMDAEDLKITGEHNIENALASICALKLYGIENSKIVQSLSNFTGVKHRMQKIGRFNGITYYNDSKSTNTDSAIKAVRSLSVPSVIILGGLDKGLEYTPLFNEILSSKVTHAVLIGESKNKMLEDAVKVGFTNISVAKSLESAIKIAQLQCEVGGAIVLSPAAASFDMFKNYADRGEKFVRTVYKLCSWESPSGESEQEEFSE